MKKLSCSVCSVIISFILLTGCTYSIKNKNVKKHNIIFITCDQRMYPTPKAVGFNQPAIDRLADRGVTFMNHYIASAVCTPSRGVLYSGRTPQVTGIQEEMMFGWTPSLSTDDISIGTAMKKLGYSTAYFGKFELDSSIVFPRDDINYTHSLVKYGFDTWQPYGEVTGEKNQGFEMDVVIASEGVSWLRKNVDSEDPWFLTLSFINPHDIFFADVNSQEDEVQKSLNGITAAIPSTLQTKRKWKFQLSNTLDEPLKKQGRPEAHWEFYNGTVGVMGEIPTDRKDMWYRYENFYRNLMVENDKCIGYILDALDDLNLWDNTIVVFTSDHGEMCGSHGGLRNKGPVAYEQNVHVPMIIVHPDISGGKTSRALTSHIDVLPTLVGLSGVQGDINQEITKGLPGKDFSTLLNNPASAKIDAIRPGILFNYVGLSTIDGKFYTEMFKNWDQEAGFAMKPSDLLIHKPDLSKKGFVSMVYDGRYKFARYYSPQNFNTPTTIQEIMNWNDVELYDLKDDPNEIHNLALDPDKNKDLILKMNKLLNELIEREVGDNNGDFLPIEVRPKMIIASH